MHYSLRAFPEKNAVSHLRELSCRHRVLFPWSLFRLFHADWSYGKQIPIGFECWLCLPQSQVPVQNVPMTIWCYISFLWNLPLPMFLQAGKEENTSLAKKGRRNPSSPEVGRWYGPHEWDGHAACVFINSLRRSSVARLLPLPSCRNAILGRQGAASYILHSVNIRKMRETSKMSELRSCYVWISTLDFGK